MNELDIFDPVEHPQTNSVPAPSAPIHVQALHLASTAWRLWWAFPHKQTVIVAGVFLLGGGLMLRNIQGNPRAQELTQSVQNPVNRGRKFDSSEILSQQQSDVQDRELNLNAFMEQEQAMELLAIAHRFEAMAAREMLNKGNADCYSRSKADCLQSFVSNRIDELSDLSSDIGVFEPIRLRLEVQGIRLAIALGKPVETLDTAEEELRRSVFEPFQSVEAGEVDVSLDNPQVRPKLLLIQLRQLDEEYQQSATLEQQAGVLLEDYEDDEPD